MNEAEIVVASRISTRTLLLGGIAGPVLFVAVFMIDGATRPGYDPMRNYVSLLSLGDGGWVERASFIVSGLLIAAFGLGLGRVWRRRGSDRWIGWLVVGVGLAFVWQGIVQPDPTQGYPPGSQGLAPGALIGIPSNPTPHALLHFLGSLVSSLGLAAAGILTARRGSRWRGPAATAWRIGSVVTAAIVLGGWALGLVTYGPDGPPATAGLLQRVSVVAAMQWLVVTAVIELRSAAALATSPAARTAAEA
jgi:hypothetical membrane protein